MKTVKLIDVLKERNPEMTPEQLEKIHQEYLQAGWTTTLKIGRVTK